MNIASLACKDTWVLEKDREWIVLISLKGNTKMGMQVCMCVIQQDVYLTTDNNDQGIWVQMDIIGSPATKK